MQTTPITRVSEVSAPKDPFVHVMLVEGELKPLIGTAGFHAYLTTAVMKTIWHRKKIGVPADVPVYFLIVELPSLGPGKVPVSMMARYKDKNSTVEIINNTVQDF